MKKLDYRLRFLLLVLCLLAFVVIPGIACDDTGGSWSPTFGDVLSLGDALTCAAEYGESGGQGGCPSR